MNNSAYPFLREIKSPLTDDQLAPLDSRCDRAQFSSPLSNADHARLSFFLRKYPNTALRVYGHWNEELTDLKFLKHYPFLRRFHADVYNLRSVDGVEYLPVSLRSFGLSQTKSKALSLKFLTRFVELQDLSLESHTKDFSVIGELTQLRSLTLRSITVPDLSPLLPLKNLSSLAIKLGGTKDLRLLPQIGALKYLELWMIRGLSDISVIGNVTTLQNVFLQALKNVSELPSFSRLTKLRRITLDTMKGLSSLARIADAPELEELVVLACTQFDSEHFRPFVKHPTLKCAFAGLGSDRKNQATIRLLNLPACDPHDSEFELR
jgi:hypothetical protein